MTTDVINGVPRELRSVLSMILSALDRDAAEGKTVRGEMAEELRTLLATAQPADHSEHTLNMAAHPAADGEREAFEAYCQTTGYTLKTGDSGRYLGGYGAEIWAGWKARAAQPQQAVAVTDEVRRLREALGEAVEYLDGTPFNEIGAGSILHRAMRDALSAHKTGEEE